MIYTMTKIDTRCRNVQNVIAQDIGLVGGGRCGNIRTIRLPHLKDQNASNKISSASWFFCA